MNEIRDMSRKQGILPIKIEINEDETLAEQSNAVLLLIDEIQCLPGKVRAERRLFARA